MRLRTALGIFALGSASVAGCGGGDTFTDASPTSLTIESVTPEYGPLAGGSRVIISGSGFLSGGAPPNRVLIGDREAPLAGAIDDATLEVVIPEADSPGEVDVVVFNQHGYITSADLFRYSTPPVIDSVSPASIAYDTGGTVTLTGSGFLDEDAGVADVRINGVLVVGVTVASDTEVSFEVLPGFPGAQLDVVLENRRGVATADAAFRYGSSGQGGLLLSPQDNSVQYLYYYDIGDDVLISSPRLDRGGGGGNVRAFRGMARAGGSLYAHRRDGMFVEIDLGSQEETEIASQTSVRYQSMDAIGGTLYVINRSNQQFGTVNVATGNFTRIGTATYSCCNYGLAANAGGTMFLVENGNNIQTINLVTGVLGGEVTLSSSQHISGMRFVGSTLYAGTQQGTIVSIDPGTGAVATVRSVGFPITEVESVDP